MSKTHSSLLKKQQGINSVEVGMSIVKVLASKGMPMTLSEIATATHMQPAKAHRYLVSLIRTGLVQQYSLSGRYELGAYALEFSLACLAKLESLSIDASVLKALAIEVQESVFTAVWSANGPIIVDWQASNRPIAASTQIGTVFPVLMSSTGRVFGAYLPTAITQALIEQELEQLAESDNPGAPKSQAEVEQIFTEVRQHGLAFGIGIRGLGINSISVPIFDYRARIVSVLTAFGYDETFDTHWEGRIARALLATATKLSKQRGFRQTTHNDESSIRANSR